MNGDSDRGVSVTEDHVRAPASDTRREHHAPAGRPGQRLNDDGSAQIHYVADAGSPRPTVLSAWRIASRSSPGATTSSVHT